MDRNSDGNIDSRDMALLQDEKNALVDEAANQRVLRTTLFNMHTNPDAFGLDSITPACDDETITKERYFEIINAIGYDTKYNYVRQDQRRPCKDI